MEQSKVDMFLMTSGKFFEGSQIPMIREKLLEADDSKFVMLQAANFKDPNTLILVSIFGGALGIDRFMVGDTGLGIAKLLTCGGLHIWTVVDWFMIMGRTREVNVEKFYQAMI